MRDSLNDLPCGNTDPFWRVGMQMLA